MATKFVYSEQDVKEITEKYSAGVTLEVLAEQYSKSVASVRMKLVKLGVYQKAVAKPATKTGATITAKTPSPTTKAGILAAYKATEAAVGLAPF